MAATVGETTGFTINIDPGGYTPQYTVSGVGSFTGQATLNLAAGIYTVLFSGPANVGSAANSFRFTVDGGGVITSVQNSVTSGPSGAAFASGNTLTFNNVSVTFDPGAYAFLYRVNRFGSFRGVQTATLVPDLLHQVGSAFVGNVGSAAYDFRFALDAAGNVTGVFNLETGDPSGAATFAGSTITFNNVSVTFEPGAYAYRYFVNRDQPPSLPAFIGPQTVTLVPDLLYQVGRAFVGNVGSAAHDFRFALDAAGNVSGLFNLVGAPSGAATFAGSTITFNNVSVTFEPGAYAYRYFVNRDQPPSLPAFFGPQTVTLVPDLLYQVGSGNVGNVGSAAYDFRFALDAAGNVTGVFNLNTGASSGAATFAGSTIAFNNVSVTIDPDGFTGQYDLHRENPALSGIRTVTLIPDLLVRLRAGAGAGAALGLFAPQTTAVNPPSLPLVISGETFVFRFTVGNAPVANAGLDQTVDEGALVALDGAASSGTGLSFSWTQLAGPPAGLSGASTPTPSFTAPPLPGGFGNQTLTFALAVSDGTRSSNDTVDVIVRNVNHAPVADAGADQVVNDGSPVALLGDFSFDPDGDPSTFQWVQTGGPAVSLSDASSAIASFTAPDLTAGVGDAATLTFALTVSDGALSHTDSVTVAVEQVNHRPVANAGTPQTVQSGQSVLLDGSVSVDPDNDPLSFQWTQVAGPTVALAGAAGVTPTFTAPPTSGSVTLTFQLIVNDAVLSSLPAQVGVTVTNGLPRCDLARANPSLLWPPNHGLRRISIAGVTDPDDTSVAITVTAVTQDEPTNGLGDGDTSPDAIVQGASALIRAERSGTGDGRVYRVSFRADDGQGASCSGAVSVQVPKSMKPRDEALDSGQAFDSTQP